MRNLPKTERRVRMTIRHHAQQYCIHDNHETEVTVDAATLSPGSVIETRDKIVDRITVKDITPDSVTVRFMEIDVTAVMDADSSDSGRYRVYGPDGHEDIRLFLKYEGDTIFDHAVELWRKVIHLQLDQDNDNPSAIAEIAELKQETIQCLDMAIAQGMSGAYPLKALLQTSDNWVSSKIERLQEFRDILLQGVDNGALAPDNEAGWKWLYSAYLYNDPAEFMTDMDRYYDLLMDATAEGDQNAREIMDSIWEPEQIIEED